MEARIFELERAIADTDQAALANSSAGISGTPTTRDESVLEPRHVGELGAESRRPRSVALSHAFLHYVTCHPVSSISISIINIGSTRNQNISVIRRTHNRYKIGQEIKKKNLPMILTSGALKKTIPVQIISENCYERNVSFKLHLGSPQTETVYPNCCPNMCYGYLTFTVSMFSIGVLTAVIGDVASHFGCTVCVHDAVTAITFVALGTSVPGLQGPPPFQRSSSPSLKPNPRKLKISKTFKHFAVRTNPSRTNPVVCHEFDRSVGHFQLKGYIYHGWICFWVSVAMIGVLTAVIGDVASHFGCSAGIRDSITAISAVALGTSLPDTFASKVSAIQDATADNSVGNVTGSNAVNVFLGIGIAWSIAALYHAWHGRPFIVPPGKLCFYPKNVSNHLLLPSTSSICPDFMLTGQSQPLHRLVVTKGIAGRDHFRTLWSSFNEDCQQLMKPLPSVFPL
ncbi:unnamed protein product [Nesidiocoris tenuis]|uniref:Sodium/calcium exchanger membrane region domain-containing protein n=1 Tax=Nesidiocoris tenuis TaxID=355587 RepID=A0A6H5H5Y4_9HEMI|nr:unnamed protein product [Nesidiocoris tenuis]